MVRDRIDSKRVELLNVLWAETIAKTENDWAEMANQKLEMYEKVTYSLFPKKHLRLFYLHSEFTQIPTNEVLHLPFRRLSV